MTTRGICLALGIAALATAPVAVSADDCPPGTAEDLLEDALAQIAALDPSPSAGNGTGPNRNANRGRFHSLQERLERAIEDLEDGDEDGALEEIESALAKTDGDSSPPDWLQGSAAEDLAHLLECIVSAIVNGPVAIDSLYVLVAPESSFGGAASITGAEIGAGGSLSVFGDFASNGDSGLNWTDSGLAASPDGSLVFVGHNRSNEVESFLRDVDGTLTPAAQVSVTSAASLDVHPYLPVLYAADCVIGGSQDAAVKVFSYTSAGALTLLQTAATADSLRGIAVHPDGTHLVTTHMFTAPGRVDVYALDGSGLGSGAPVDTETPSSTGRISDVRFDVTGDFVYVHDLDNGIYAFSFAGGALTPLNSGTPYATTGEFSSEIAMAGGAIVAVSFDAPPFVSTHFDVFPINGDGTLGTKTSMSVSDVNQQLAVTSDGGTVFASSRTSNQVWSLTLNPTTHVLSVNAGSPIAISNAAGETGEILVVD